MLIYPDLGHEDLPGVADKIMEFHVRPVLAGKQVAEKRVADGW